MNQSAFDTQIGGSHYKDCWMQPAEFWMLNQLPAAEGAVLKYLFRWRRKAGVEDLKKGRHFIELMLETYFSPRSETHPVVNHPYFRWTVTPEDFCMKNGVDSLSATVICLVCRCEGREYLEAAIKMIDYLIANAGDSTVELAKHEGAMAAYQHWEAKAQ